MYSVQKRWPDLAQSLMNRGITSMKWLAPVSYSSVVVNKYSLFGFIWSKRLTRWTFNVCKLSYLDIETKCGNLNTDWFTPSTIMKQNCSGCIVAVSRFFGNTQFFRSAQPWYALFFIQNRCVQARVYHFSQSRIQCIIGIGYIVVQWLRNTFVAIFAQCKTRMKVRHHKVVKIRK